MIRPVKQLFNRFCNIGVHDQLRIDMADRVRLANVMVLAPLPVFIYYIFYGIVFQSPPSVIMAVFSIAIAMLALWCNHRRHYHLAKSLMFAAYSLDLFIACNIFNVDNSMTAFFFPLFFGYAVFYNFAEESKVAFPLMAFTLLCCIASFVVPKYLFYKMELSPRVAYLSNNYIHYIASFFISLVFTILITRINARTQHKLIAASLDAERASKAKTVFLSNMSHELRTPLTGIIGTTHLLMDEEMNEKQRDYLSILENTSQHMLQLVNEVLDFSKIEAGKMKLQPASFQLKQLLESAAGSVRVQLQKKRLRFHLVANAETDVRITGDDVKLRQVLTNLLSNACKFTDAGDVTLAAKVLQNSHQHLQLEFSVTDTGIGIHPDMQQQVFQSFTQADNSASRKVGGTGLGLAISYQFVALMGGRLQVESEPGKGSRFHFTISLPVANESTADSDATVTGGQESLQGARVLIAEDNVLSMKVMLAFMKKWGVQATPAVNGLEAVALFKQQPFDLLLLDIEMPGMDGYTAIREIRSMDKEVTALAFTAALYPDMQNDLIQKGFNGYINKPVNPADLQQLLRQYLNGPIKTTAPAV
jgi:signal transduction histidine kinase/ActR/RegA family two-component response regulator